MKRVAMFGGLALAAAVTLLLTLADPVSAQQVVKREPAMGALREGQRVLVDDGSCGPGKIKLVIGGNHVKVGGTKDIVRERHCISR